MENVTEQISKETLNKVKAILMVVAGWNGKMSNEEMVNRYQAGEYIGSVARTEDVARYYEVPVSAMK
ncbi:hypothetical protein [Microcoleus sp. FACHB-672]|uniref:hypothetical protein n=1 Tax=Microcoleus sp. FACHB-672 TaxID=2692825 RepID=UPI001685B8BC|nr:hypothetical protein [Microcoleus sp. FACHB-672]MBD2041707.1 hypothetical protein [Microcoleus sp. FACHB-672]